jgi:hypothetical protein
MTDTTVMHRIARTLTVVFLVAVAVNYPWELAQAPLFAWPGDTRNPWWHCFVASLGDGVLVLLIFGVGRLVLRRHDWFARPGTRGYALLFTTGVVLAVAVEWVAVHVLQRWTYLPAMPRLPMLDIGIVPILQMLVLPPLIFRIAAARIFRGHSDGAKHSR